MQGSWGDNDDTIMDHHPVHTLANGGDARDGTGEEVRQVPRARPARLWGEAGAIHCGASATGG